MPKATATRRHGLQHNHTIAAKARVTITDLLVEETRVCRARLLSMRTVGEGGGILYLDEPLSHRRNVEMSKQVAEILKGVDWRKFVAALVLAAALSGLPVLA